MTGKLMFVPDTHVVVPREPTDEMYARIYRVIQRGGIVSLSDLQAAITAAPHLTTPSVLRWEGYELFVGKAYLGQITNLGWCGMDFKWIVVSDDYGYAGSDQEARRAAEKALGLPIVEEV